MHAFTPTPRRSALLAATIFVGAAIVAPASATHDDGVYDQRVWFTWNTTTIDVLVIPPEPGAPVSFNWLQATLDAIEQWKVGIDAYGADWLKTGVTLNVYVLPFDVPPAEAIADAEIIATPVGTPFLAAAINAFATRQCVLTTGFGTYTSHFQFMSHEFGHCLGLDHPGLGGNAQSTFHPNDDVMAYGPDDDLSCVSNLNILTMERAFGAHFGQASGGKATLPVNQYRQIDCNAQFGP